MENLIICVECFTSYLFLTMSFSLHKVPFVNWTYTGIYSACLIYQPDLLQQVIT